MNTKTAEDPVDPNARTLPSDGGGGTELRASDPMIATHLGHFRIDALLGRGGMGAVYRAWDTSLARPVALKTLLADSGQSRERFLREARLQAQLRHPNVVPIHFVGEENGLTYIVMDLVEGETLAALLERSGRVPDSRALDIADAVACALEAAHERGLIHRDIKPSNILIEKNGRVLLADFGLAKGIGSDEPKSSKPHASMNPAASGVALTNAGAIVGTPRYLAPEQAAGAAVDHRADIYALGVTLYEVLTGQPPFTSENQHALLQQHREEIALSPRLLMPELRPSIEALVMRMLQKRPEDRFATYAEFRRALDDSRPKSLVDAPIFTRAIAFGIDLVAIGAVAAVLTMASKYAAWPVAAIAAGLLEAAWGTPGKRLMRIRTVDTHGSAMSFSRSILRALVKYSVLIVYAFVDLLPATGPWQIPRIAVFVLWGLGFLLAFGRGKRTLHDYISQTREVFAFEVPAK